ncbi:uncharacterized protein LOC123363738 [Mauremys mutica]|uniref:uncharacterized protein LOC123363738 n=1 Tax=Mauremys mutica TaxID=74926 RepID=UPI001D13DF2C|nr:uncharacterized protein LOC123363738 [Mauremys mutica]
MALISARNHSSECQECAENQLPGVNSEVWAEGGGAARAKNAVPVHISLKEGSSPARIRQYPLKLTIRIGLKPLIQKFLQCGWLREGTSPYNTPIMGVPKPNGQYRLVQDLRQINKLIEAPYPVVPNPHTILGQVPKNHGWFSVIDLKDAFFSIPLDLESQKLFAFEWEDPDTHYKAQYLWTVVPQGLTCAPEIFGSQLKRDLAPFLANHPACNIVQYCDDLLLSAETEAACKEHTIELLNYLGEQGYKVSKEKAQLVKQQVTFLGYHLCQGSRSLGKERIQVILDSPQPRNPRELRAFLGLTGFCRLWIPDYGGKARPLYESLTKEGLLHWVWTKEMEKAFRELKEALVQPPALALPDSRKPFTLYVHERGGVAAGVLCQRSGPTWRPIGYYSKVLDPVAKGWPACLRAVAATALLVQEAEKLTLGGDTEVVVPHGVPQILGTGAGEKHLNPSRHTRYEVGLLLAPNLTFKTVSSLNPATLLPDPQASSEAGPIHDCIEVLQQETKPRSDLSDLPWPNPDVEGYVDGSSYVVNGKRFTGAAVVIKDKGIHKFKLSPNLSAQAAELVALIEALRLGAGKTLNLYTDSRYAYMVVHAHGTLWRERGFITASGQKIAHGSLIKMLLEALMLPLRVAVIHVRAHGKAPEAEQRRYNQLADQAAKEAARDGALWLLMVQDTEAKTPPPQYTAEEIGQAQAAGGRQVSSGWWRLPGGEIFVPRPVLQEIFRLVHKEGHLGSGAMVDLAARSLKGLGMHMEAQRIVNNCTVCQQTNQKGCGPPAPMGGRPWAMFPFQRWQVDFAEVPPCRGYKYLLVFVDQLTGWVECYPTRHCQARAVTKALVQEILPRFHLPEVIESDRGSHFVSQVVQQVSQALGIQWKLHTPWRPQSSGQVERMNRTLKDTLTKICTESNLKWLDALPLALTRIRRAPRKGLKLSPFELVFGFPPRVLIPGFREDVTWEVGNDLLWKQVSGLQSVLLQLHRYAAPFQALPLDQTVHPFRIGDQVLIKKWKRDPLTPRWDGPHTVSLISQAAVKVLGSDKWTHHTRVKRFLNPNLEADSTEEDISPLSAPAPEARGGTGEDTVWEYQGLDGLKGLFKRKR